MAGDFAMAKEIEKDEYPDDVAARRRDAVLKILVNTPRQPRTTRRPGQSGKQKPTGAGQARKAVARPGKP
jgi:hypothetical protein